jgi:hypothetical protein
MLLDLLLRLFRTQLRPLEIQLNSEFLRLLETQLRPFRDSAEFLLRLSEA